MTTKKAIFFIAGASPTVDEAAAIAVLQLAATKPFDLFVRRADLATSAAYSYGAGPEACDFVAGTPPNDNPIVQLFASMAGTFSGVGTAADTITIGAVVYTLRAAPTTVANEILIGGTAAETAANLAAAINLTGTPGTDYGSLTVIHPTVSAVVESAVVTVTAKVAGVGGNAILLAEAGTGFSWAGGAVLLAGGGPSGFYEEKPLLITSGSGDTVTVTTIDGDMTTLVLS